MNEEIHHCNEINSKELSFFFQTGSSPVGKRVLILGESLAKNGWVESDEAFYTKEGKLVPTGRRLNEELAQLDFTLEECAFTEIAKCYIGKNRKQLSNCGLLCGNHLVNQINHFKPKLILSLGVITKDVLQEIFQTNLSMGVITEMFLNNKYYNILPLYHPSPANPFGHPKNIKIISDNKKVIKDLIN